MVNWVSNNVSVINTATDNVTSTVPVGSYPVGVEVDPMGTRVYVAHQSGIVSVIDMATNAIINTMNVGATPMAFGRFIGTPP